MSGTVSTVKAIDEKGKPYTPQETDIQKASKPPERKKSTLHFFSPRDMLTGFNIHLISPDRGVIFYSPVLLLGLIGLATAQSKKSKFIPVLVSVALVNFVLYSMWGDPYGGWAFGSRYLIPAYAIICIFLSFALTRFSKSILFIVVFSILATYSIGVNTLGAITTSQNPPKVEAIPLSQLSGREEKYTYERNFDYLIGNKSKSFLWRTWFSKYLNSVEYYLLIADILTIVTLTLTLTLFFQKKGEKE